MILHIFSKSCEHVKMMEDNALKKHLNHSSYGKMAEVHWSGIPEIDVDDKVATDWKCNHMQNVSGQLL
jgi:hypothetical protein